MKILDVPRSGSYAGVTSSRNRFGQYVRTRAVPVNPNSTFQSTVRTRMAASATAWRNLTAAQHAAWAALGAQMSRTDALGQAYTLTGLQAFASVNNNLQAAGAATVVDAPALITPDAMATGTMTMATLSLAFTPTPLAAGEKLFVFASPPRSAGRNYESDYRLIAASAAAQASPFVVLTEYTARFGAIPTGAKVFFSLVRYNGGFISQPLNISGIGA